MAGYPPKKNTAFTFYVSLVSQASRPQFQANPTLAAGDVKVAIDDGALNNLATLPDAQPDGSKVVRVQLSAAEMNGDNIQVLFSDAAGAEWDDLLIEIQTSAAQVGDAVTLANGAHGGAAATITLQTPIYADVRTWLASIPAALSASGYVQSILLRWLTDNAAGTPNALSSGDVPADVKLWLASAPAALTASGYLQAALLRWLTDNAAGTPLALSANKVQSVDSTVPTANAVADQVWDEAIGGHLGVGSTGATLNGLAPGAAIVLNADITEIHT